MGRVNTAIVRNGELVQKSGGWGIDAGIRAGDLVTTFFQHARERRHGRAGNADDVDVFGRGHGITAVSRNSRVPLPSAFRRPRMPSGTVSMGRGVWPTAAP